MRVDAARAAANNARWCDAVCRAYGRPGEFVGGLWFNRGETPPFYPNAITLDTANVSAQLRQIEALTGSLAGEWGVKDSFCALDLGALGFRVLFQAEWIHLREPARRRDAGVRCTRVGSEAELAAWEAGWAVAPSVERIFRPALLDDSDVAVLAALREDEIVGGVIANRSGEVAGVSNLFARGDDAEAVRGELIAGAAGAFPGCELVGYEAGADLETMRGFGFAPLGPLRIWLRSAERQPS